MVHLAHLDLLVHLVQVDLEENQAQEGLLDLLVHLDLQGLLASVESKEILELRVKRARPDQQERLGRQDHEE